MRRLAIAVAAMLVAATAGAQMYRWVDKDGKVHYTDTPPPAAAKSIQKRGTAPAPTLTFAHPQASANTALAGCCCVMQLNPPPPRFTFSE